MHIWLFRTQILTIRTIKSKPVGNEVIIVL